MEKKQYYRKNIFEKGDCMKVFGVVLNHNVLAVFMGIFIIVLCMTVAYLFQKKLFDKYQKKVANAMNKDDRELK